MTYLADLLLIEMTPE
jgi:hypothetical protein